ncbi:MAG: HAD family phosphatase [Acidobacteria bacterium]|nr:HAD family phosphatase [Acidobacteriota bacterium]
MPAYDAILFDFDGVLIDTEPLHYACWMQVLAPYGIDLTWEEYARRWIGVSDRAMLHELAPLAQPPVEGAALLEHHPAKKELFRRRSLESQPWVPGLPGFLASLHGYKLAVVTSSGRGEVAPLLEAGGIRRFFGAEVFGNDTPRLKPAPDPYLRAAELLGARTPLVVEDSPAGMESARAAGFDCVMVPRAREMPSLVEATLGRGAECGGPGRQPPR